MSNKRRSNFTATTAGTTSLTINKKGTPVYSREDIREQYCINDKELFALEASRRKPIFGCLTSVNTQPSPCKKKQLIPSCLRADVQSDECSYSRNRQLQESPRKKPIDYEDESYFKRRPKTICHTDPKILASLDDNLVRKIQNESFESRQKSDHQICNFKSEKFPASVNSPPASSQGLAVQKTSFTQPNTPDVMHSDKFKPTTSEEKIMDEQNKINYNKHMSRSITAGMSDGTNIDPMMKVDKTSIDANKEPIPVTRKFPGSEKPPAGCNAIPMDRKAILEEKIKRACMKTQATQTDAALLRKSMPHLSQNSKTEKTEMISQGAQTNGSNDRRKLVKSLSEAAKYDHIDDESLDGSKLKLPLSLIRYYSNRQETKLHCHNAFNEFEYTRKKSQESISENNNYSKSNSNIFMNSYFTSEFDHFGEFAEKSSSSSYRDDDLTYFSSPYRGEKRLTKAFSEGQILLDRKKALSFASGFVDVNIDSSERICETYIKPKFVDECSSDLSNSKLFSSGSLIDESDEPFHEDLIYPDYSYKTDLISFDSPYINKSLQTEVFDTTPTTCVFDILPTTIFISSKSSLGIIDDYQNCKDNLLLMSPTEQIPSPIEPMSIIEIGDHFEESVSESQVTVLQKLPENPSSNQCFASDSENGSFHFTDHSSSATTPSSKHKIIDKNLLSEEMDEYNQTSKILLSTLSTSNLSSISDEQESILDNTAFDDSQNIFSMNFQSIDNMKGECFSGGEHTQKISDYYLHSSLSSQEDYYCGIRETDSIINKLATGIQEESASIFAKEIRRLTSPESDSSSSHFTEQETTRSPTSHATNTIASRTDISHSDSHPLTDYSETSEDYMTATENGNGASDKKFDEKAIVSPLPMEFLLEEDQRVNLSSNLIDIVIPMVSQLDDIQLRAPIHFSGIDCFTKEGNPKAENLYFSDVTTSDSSSSSMRTETATFIPDTKTALAQYPIKSTCKNNSSIASSESSIIDLKESSNNLSQSKSDTIELKKAYHPISDIPYSYSSDDDNRKKLRSCMKLNFPSNEAIAQGSKADSYQYKKEPIITADVFQNSKRSTDIDSFINQMTPISPPIAKLLSRVSPQESMYTGKTKQCRVTTPGMVRSPAMHEGFKLEDWVPVRTPGTPERLIDFDTSDDSCDDNLFFSKQEGSLHKHRAVGKKNKSVVHGTCNSELCSTRKSSDCERMQLQRENKWSPMQYADIRSNFSKIENQPVKYRQKRSFQNISQYTDPTITQNMRRRSDVYSASWRNQTKELPNTECVKNPSNIRKAGSLKSFSLGFDNMSQGSSSEQLEELKVQLCAHCGEKSLQGINTIPPAPAAFNTGNLQDKDARFRTLSHRTRSEERKHFNNEWERSAVSLEHGDMPRTDGDDDERGLYTESYRSYRWLYVAPSDELLVWKKECLPFPKFPSNILVGSESIGDSQKTPYPEANTSRSDSPDSSSSEREFCRKYKAVTHRMIHRKASGEMYRRIINCTFKQDKAVLILKDSGEFGFRIHGSRPVVVSAIEEDTPAKTSGLEVGDIILSINDINVLDASHSDVVRLAHSGSEVLRLEIARTNDVLVPHVNGDPSPMCAGYLFKLGKAHYVKGSPSVSRKWKRRWFTLKKDYCLYFYKSELDYAPLGALYLLDYNVHISQDEGRPFEFTLAKFGGLVLYLAAHTESDRRHWAKMISQASYQAAQRDELIEESTRFVKQSPAAILSPDCCGFLHKLGLRWHQWKRRYCVLKDACLYLYYDITVPNAIGVIHLHGYRVQGTAIGGRKNAFELIPPDPKFRHFYFFVESENEKRRWLAGLEYSIDRWIKAA